LRNLDVIRPSVQNIVGDLDISKIPLDDKKTYADAFCEGRRGPGVFQFGVGQGHAGESLRQVKTTVFERPDRPRRAVTPPGAD